MTTNLDGGIFTIEISGELDSGNAGLVSDAVQEAEAATGVKGIVLDITRLEFIDSSGIAVLGSAAKRDEGGRLRVTGSTTQVERVLEITGVADLLPRAGNA